MPAAVVAGDFSNADGRLIVLWRGDAPGSVSAAGIARSERSASGRRSLVVAAPGQTDAVISQLRTDKRIAAILPDAPMTAAAWPETAPDDTYYGGYQPDLPLIGVPAAWLTTIGAPSVIVAVLDTGMTRTHADLDGVSVVAPRNEIANTTNVADGNGHGTHVIGTIAAETNNGVGVAGVAPGVSIILHVGHLHGDSARRRGRGTRSIRPPDLHGRRYRSGPHPHGQGPWICRA